MWRARSKRAHDTALVMINDGGVDHPNRGVIWISENFHVLKGGMDGTY